MDKELGDASHDWSLARRYIELLKVEKSSDSSPRSAEKELHDHGSKKSILEMEKTIFTLKRIIEKLQVENRRMKLASKKSPVHQVGSRLTFLILFSRVSLLISRGSRMVIGQIVEHSRRDRVAKPVRGGADANRGFGNRFAVSRAKGNGVGEGADGRGRRGNKNVAGATVSQVGTPRQSETFIIESSRERENSSATRKYTILYTRVKNGETIRVREGKYRRRDETYIIFRYSN